MAAVVPTLSSLLFRLQTKSIASLTDGNEVGATTFTQDVNQAITNGTGANKANAEWSDEITLTTTATTNIDLEACVGQHGTVKFSKIKLIVIELETRTDGYRLLIGGSGGDEFSAPFAAVGDKAYVPPGGVFVFSNLATTGAIGTVDGTHHLLKIDNPSGGTIVANIWVLGEGTYAQP